MPSRYLVVPAALCAVLGAAPAFAGPKSPLCHLIPPDNRPRSTVAYTTDINSGDVATGARSVVMVIRLKSLDVESDPGAWAGAAYGFTFVVGRSRYTALYEHPGKTGMPVKYSFAGSANGVKAEFDVQSATVSWTVARSRVVELRGSTGRKLEDITAWADAVGAGEQWVFRDVGEATRPYVDRTPSCVRAT